MSTLAEYAAMLRNRKNPYDRVMQGTAAVMRSMPEGGGVTGLEGLGKLPLMYAMGKAQADASAFDEQQDQKEDSYLQEIMKMKREESGRELVLKEQESKARQIETALKSAKSLAEAGSEGEAVKLLNQAGVPVVNFRVVPNGFQSQGKDGKWYMLTADAEGKPVPQVWDTKTKQWRPQDDTDLPIAEDKPTGHVVEDTTSTTGWGYLTERGKKVPGAPDPTKAKERTIVENPHAEEKDFKGYVSQLDGLYKARASIEKGYDPITGQVIPQTQIYTAKATINSQISDKEGYIASQYPDKWKAYRKPIPGTPAMQQVVTDAQLKAMLNSSGGDKQAVRSSLIGGGYTHYPDGTPIR